MAINYPDMDLPKKVPESVDLDLIVDQFDQWQEVISSLQKNKSELRDKVHNLEVDNTRLNGKTINLEKEVEELHGMVGDLHKQLHRICDLEDDNCKLKCTIKEKDADANEMKSEIKLTEGRSAKALDDLKKENETEMKKAVQMIRDEMDQKVYGLRIELGDKENALVRMEDQLMEMDNDKQAQIVKITMEYEDKLSKLHRQKLQATNAAPSSSVTQDIFRKKLQHMKEESDREIALLRSNITDLHQRLSMASSHNRQPTDFTQAGKLSLPGMPATKRRRP